MLSGTSIAAHGMRARIDVFGAEPAGACDAADSLASNTRITGRSAQTICDGLRAELGTLTFPILREHVREVLVVDDDAVLRAMRLLWERMKLVVEPSAAIGLAVVLANPQVFAGRRVGIVLTGGNVDLDVLPTLFARAGS